MSGGNQFVSGAHAPALGNQSAASVAMPCDYQPSSGAIERSPRSAERCDRSNAAVPGPQYLVRAQSMRPVTGRPDAIEQQLIAAGVGALLHQLRSARRMGLRDLEARSGVARSTITRVERGLRRPRRSLLGWLAWGLDAEDVGPLTAHLVAAAGDSLVAENRWSERAHARHAADALMRGTLPVPFVLLAPRAVDALGGVLPGELDRLRQVQAMASQVPWPPGMDGSAEALVIANALMGLSRTTLDRIGRAAVRVNDYGALRDRKRRERAERAVEREKFMQAGCYAAGRRMPAGMRGM